MIDSFWVVLLAVLVILQGWAIYLLFTTRRAERRGRLEWKSRYYEERLKREAATDD